jgi:hypothetical protein
MVCHFNTNYTIVHDPSEPTPGCEHVATDVIVRYYLLYYVRYPHVDLWFRESNSED